MVWRLVASIIVFLVARALGKRVAFPNALGKKIRRRLAFAFLVFLACYLVLAAVRLATNPPALDQLATLGFVVTALGLLWLGLRLALALVHSR